MEYLRYKDFNVNQRINLKGNMQIIAGSIFARRGWQNMLRDESDHALAILSKSLSNHNWVGKNDFMNIHSKNYVERQKRKVLDQD